jgi:hypothetical protein
MPVQVTSARAVSPEARADWVHRFPWWVLPAVAASAVVSICTIRALADGVQLVSERALFEIRARDVFSMHPPLLGLRSSAAESQEFNHLGPLQFWLLAVPVRVLGGVVGVTLATAAINIASIWLAVLAGRRVHTSFALAVGAVATALCWSMGSDLLFDPWQPNALVLPFMALLSASAAVVAGACRWLLAVVVTATLCAQTHLSYLIIAPTLVGLSVGAIVVRARRDGQDLPWRLLAATGSLTVILWLPPIVQQLFGDGPGNLGTISSDTAGGSRAGPSLALRLYAAITAVPPAWLRPGYDEDPPKAVLALDGTVAYLDDSRLPTLTASAVAVVVIVAAATLAVRSARTRHVTGTAASLLVAGVATLAASVTIALLPMDVFGLGAHKYRFAWPLAAFTAACLLGHLIAVLQTSRRQWPNIAAVSVVIGGSVVLAADAARVREVPTSGMSDRQAWSAVADLRRQVAALRTDAVVLVQTNGLAWPDYYSQPVLAELSEQGVPFQVTTEPMVTQLGRQRRPTTSATLCLVIRQGEDAGRAPSGSRQIAFASPSSGPPVGVYIHARASPETAC